MCLAWGFEINGKDSEIMMSPLHLAVNSGSTRLVQKLLKAGADKEALDSSDLKPIDLAI